MAALPAIAAIATLAGSAASAMGSIQQGKAQQAALNYEAQMKERQAAEERSAAQREATEKLEEGKRIGSRGIAIAAASGGGVLNPSSLDIYGETIEKGDLNARVATYGGESRARGLQDQAAANRFKGAAAKKGSIFEAFGTMASGVGKAFG